MHGLGLSGFELVRAGLSWPLQPHAMAFLVHGFANGPVMCWLLSCLALASVSEGFCPKALVLLQISVAAPHGSLYFVASQRCRAIYAHTHTCMCLRVCLCAQPFAAAPHPRRPHGFCIRRGVVRSRPPQQASHRQPHQPFVSLRLPCRL